MHLTAVEAQLDKILSLQTLILPSSITLPLRDWPLSLNALPALLGQTPTARMDMATIQTPTSEKSGGVKVFHPKTALCVRGNL